MPFCWVWMDHSLSYVPQFLNNFYILLAFNLVIPNPLLLLVFWLLFSCLFYIFFPYCLTELSSLLRPLGFWCQAFPVGVCSRSVIMNNDNNWLKRKLTQRQQAPSLPLHESGYLKGSVLSSLFTSSFCEIQA